MLQPRNVLSFFAVLLVLTAGCGQSSERVAVDDTKPEVRTVILDETNSMLIAKAKSDLGRWYYAAAANEWQRAVDANEARERAEADRRRANRRQSATTGSGVTSTASAPSSSGCGWGIPWEIVQRESHGSYTAENPVSTASGAYQFLDGTWNGYGGYHHASDAPPCVQDEKARQTWAGGAGACHWRPNRWC